MQVSICEICNVLVYKTFKVIFEIVPNYNTWVLSDTFTTELKD